MKNIDINILQLAQGAVQEKLDREFEDGGAWRNQAILNIKKYLGEQLSDEIRKGKITILA